MRLRRASTTIAIAGVAACSPAAGGLAPQVQPLASGSAVPAALGWTLGSEVHLFIADSDLTYRVYRSVVQPHLSAAPPTFDAAVAPPRRSVVTVAAESLKAAPDRRDPLTSDITVLSTAAPVPADLRLVRLHAPGDCLVPAPVTELVFGFSQASLPSAPPSHTTVVGLFGRRATPGRATVGERLTGEPARRYIRRVALDAERRTRVPGTTVAWPLGDRLAVDMNAATDAGEALKLEDRSGVPKVAVGVRVRFIESSGEGDTVLVSGVAIADTAGRRIAWVTRPVRVRLRGGGVVPQEHSAPLGVRYVLHGWTARGDGDGPLLLIDQIAEVSALDSRTLVVDPHGPRVLAAQPLALRCR